MGVGAVITVVGPHHRLHPGAQLAVVAVQVHTDKLAKAAYIAAAAQVHGKTFGSFLADSATPEPEPVCAAEKV